MKESATSKAVDRYTCLTMHMYIPCMFLYICITLFSMLHKLKT